MYLEADEPIELDDAEAEILPPAAYNDDDSVRARLAATPGLNPFQKQYLLDPRNTIAECRQALRQLRFRKCAPAAVVESGTPQPAGECATRSCKRPARPGKRQCAHCADANNRALARYRAKKKRAQSPAGSPMSGAAANV
jgi:hypothetical protein